MAMPLSLLRVKLSFATNECISAMATVSLYVLREAGMEHNGAEHDGRLLCGPVHLLPLLDVTGQSVMVPLSHPSLLLLRSSAVLLVMFDDLFPMDYCKITERASKASDDKKADADASVTRRRPGMRSRITKRSPAPDKATKVIHTYVQITVFRHEGAAKELQQKVISNIYREELMVKLLISCCDSDFEEKECDNLSHIYQSLARENMADRMCEMDRYQCMDTVCWIMSSCGQDISNR